MGFGAVGSAAFWIAASEGTLPNRVCTVTCDRRIGKRMKRLIEFPLEDGGSVIVEVDEVEIEGGVVRVARPGELAAKAVQTFESALETIAPAAGTILAKLRSLIEPPDTINVEFGIKLNADAKAYIASAGVEANYRVTLTWRSAAKP